MKAAPFAVLVIVGLLGCTTEKIVVVPEKQYEDAKTKQAAQKTQAGLQSDKTWQQLMNNTKGNQ